MQNDIKQTEIIIKIMTIHFQTDTTQRQNKPAVDFNEFSEILISLSVSFQWWPLVSGEMIKNSRNSSFCAFYNGRK